METHISPDPGLRPPRPAGVPAQGGGDDARPSPADVLDRFAAFADPDLLRLPLPKLLQETLDRLKRIFRADVCALFLLDRAAGRLELAAATGLTVPLAGPVPVGVGVPGRVVALGEPVLGDGADPADPMAPAMLSAGVRSVLGVPLVAGDHVFGALVVGEDTPDGLSPEDIPVLTLAATHVALAVDYGLLLAAERTARGMAERAMERLGRLQRLTAALAGALSETDVVRTVVSPGLQLLDAVAGAVWTADGDRLRLTGATGYPPAVTDRLGDVALDAPYPTAAAARERRPVLLPTLATRDELFPALVGQPSVGDAFAALPLTLGDELLGVLAVSLADGVRLGDPSDVEFLDAVAAQCAVAMHRVSVIAAERQARRLEEAAMRRLSRLQSFTAQLSSATSVAQVADMVVRELAVTLDVPRCVLSLLDPEREALVTVQSTGVSAPNAARFEAVPLDARLPVVDAVREGRTVALHDLAERDRRYPALAGVPPYDDHTLVVLPLLVEDDPIGAISLSFPDVRRFDGEDMTFLDALAGQCAQAIERSRLSEGQRRSRRQLALLAETGRLFASSLDLDVTLERVCRLLSPAMVDFATARVFDAKGDLVLAAMALAEPALEGPLRRLWDAGGERSQARLRDIVEAGEPVFERDGVLGPRPGREPVDLSALDPAVRADLEALALESIVQVPLRARGRSVGLISVATRRGRPSLGDTDLPFLVELAGRVALAVENARLFRHQAEIAHTLQRSLLPTDLPAVEGAELAVRYLPGMEGTTVGGDFYDVIPLPSGRVGFVIGDVMGRGVRAAAVMGQLRAAVRAYAMEGHGPAALLARLDRLVTSLEDELLVTCVYGEWDPDRAMATVACAGHPPPLVRTGAGPLRFLEIDPALPLGVGAVAATDVDVELPAGSLLLAYTDGIVESPDLPLQDGMAALMSALAGAPASAAEVCRLAVEGLGPTGRGGRGRPGGGRRHDDDIALLALVSLDGGDGRSTALHRSQGGVYAELPADPGSPSRARDTVAEALYGWDLGLLVDTAVLLASELVTNAVRHAGTALRLSVRQPAPGRVRVEVTDHAREAQLRPRGASTSAEGGRGLLLVQALAAAWGTELVPGGKTVWFELDESGG